VARHSTGMAGLDSLLGGGFPPGHVYLVSGEPMNAMELIGYHCASATAAGGSAGYFATENTPEEIKLGIQAVGGNPERVHVIPLPYQGKWVVPDAKKGMRYVVDSLSMLILNAGFMEAYQNLKRVKAQMRQNGDNLIVLVTAGLHSEKEVAMLRQWADGVMELGFDRQGFGLYPYLKISKMRGTPDSARLLLVKETDRGLSLDSTKRVF